MRYSKSLIKTLKETPRGSDNISSALLLRGSYIDQETSGIYSLLPLGWKVVNKISNIIRNEMDRIGGQEVYLPSMQPKELWEVTGRWNTMDPPLFKFKDRHEKEFALSSTNEEAVVDIVKDRISSYKELPQMFYQIQNKFRNEQRFTGGLLRVKEFLMKDAYSFHADEKDFGTYYLKITEAYKSIFKKTGVEVRMVQAHSGSIGGKRSNEFMLLSETGEDRVFLCNICDWAANAELTTDVKKCPGCGGQIKESKAIEVAHIFDLEDLYSKKMDANFVNKDGKEKPYLMGCYGIGIGRLAASIVEAFHDEKGIIWPEEVAPFQVYLADLTNGKANKIYDKLIESGLEVLYDDREVSPGIKFSDADLLGIPWRIVVSEKTIAEDKVEVKKRQDEKVSLDNIDNIIQKLRK